MTRTKPISESKKPRPDATAKLPRDEEGRLPFHGFVAQEIAAAALAGSMRGRGASPEEIREALAEHGITDDDS